MNLIKNIPFGTYMIGEVLFLTQIYRRRIDKAHKAGDFEKEREGIATATNDWAQRIFKHYKVNVETEGIDQIPAGPVVFVLNHQAYGDVPLLFFVLGKKQTGFVAKTQLGKVPFYGKWMTRIRCLMIERGDQRAAVRLFQKGEDWIRDGFSIAIFPEGTRSKSEQMGTFKKGSLHLATRSGVPIVPVTISGTWHLYEEKGFPQKGKTVKFYIHPPIETADIPRNKQAELSNQIETIIRSKLIEWNGEESNGNI